MTNTEYGIVNAFGAAQRLGAKVNGRIVYSLEDLVQFQPLYLAMPADIAWSEILVCSAEDELRAKAKASKQKDKNKLRQLQMQYDPSLMCYFNPTEYAAAMGLYTGPAPANGGATPGGDEPGGGASAKAPALSPVEEAVIAKRRLATLLDDVGPETIGSILESFQEIAITCTHTLQEVIELLFDHAIADPLLCESYAQLCTGISEKTPEFKEGAKTINFRRVLLTRCYEALVEEPDAQHQQPPHQQQQQQHMTTLTVSNNSKPHGGAAAAPQHSWRRRCMLRNVRLIGELFRRQLLTENVMHVCVAMMLDDEVKPQAEVISAACELLTLVGDLLDGSSPASRRTMDEYFAVFSRLGSNVQLPAAVKTAVSDMTALRSSGWAKKRTDATPSPAKATVGVAPAAPTPTPSPPAAATEAVAVAVPVVPVTVAVPADATAAVVAATVAVEATEAEAEPAAEAAEPLEYIGAVTLVRFSADGSLLFVGVGPAVSVYAAASGALVAQFGVFPRGILHGSDFVASSDDNGVVAAFFGQKRVALLRGLPQTLAQALDDDAVAAATAAQRTRSFGDWVFDVRVLISQTQPRLALAVGLAHNYVQIWEPERDCVLRSVQCAERCILYALAFHGRSVDELVVAAGTVFQQILLWKPFASSDDGRNDDDAGAVAPAQRLHSHNGVLFKLEWSDDASMLASVSDDRTVQLWSTRGAGCFPVQSAARRADGFLESTHATLAIMRAQLDVPAGASADLSQRFRSVFRSWGHSARLWDVKFCAYGLATTSEDAACKIWDFAGNCLASLHGHAGRHVWRVAVHPSQAVVATGGADGAVKLWDLHDQAKSTSSDSDAFCRRIPLFADSGGRHARVGGGGGVAGKTSGKSKTAGVRDIVVEQRRGERAFLASELGQIFAIDVPAQTSSLFYTLANNESEQLDSGALAPPSHPSTLALDSGGELLLVGDSVGVVSIIDTETATLTLSWRAHASRVIKVLWDRDGASSSLFTLSVDGAVREWRAVAVENESSSGSGGLGMQLVASFKSPGKSAASTLLVVDRAATRNIVCGDGRGNVFVFRRSLRDPPPVANSVEGGGAAGDPPSLVLRGVHGRDQVSALVLHDRVLYSGGHDGYLCSYATEFSDAAGDEGALRLRSTGRDSIKGVATVKSLWLSAARELFVLGFYASQAILYNASAQYRIFSIECGGWRRPHALVTRDVNGSGSLPAHTFLFTPPVASKADALELKVHSTIAPRAAPPPLLAAISLHHQYHGKMTTCVVQIGDRLVTAADDNSIKLHRQQLPAARWQCVATGVAHTTTVRALTHFRVGGAHIVLSGGGKQRVSAWRVPDDADAVEFVCGFESEQALQDHRILGLATFAVAGPSGDSERHRLVAACNSEGAVQLLLLDLARATLVELGHVRSSKKPILSCAGFQRRHGSDAAQDAAMLAVGSTDGLVTLWSLAGVVRELESAADDLTAVANAAAFRRLLSYLVPVEAYVAHAMGVNCLAIARHDASSFAVVSGGDDQSVRLRAYATGGESYEVAGDARAANASGSAIKAVYADGARVFVAGYDQRVSQWRIVDSDAAGAASPTLALEWQCAAFSECADIAGLAAWESGAGAHTVVVVGQGLQTIRFHE
ncbi:hypothetical protein PybrP1_000728 [[Pythium] brassicae (nom. inval.)]|nr:hypothetical protein PybrP1_000728 [[Pythium] brassicae (nom. inval.)]